VDVSAEACEPLEVHDAFLGFVSDGVTMTLVTLAAMGSPDGSLRQQWLPLALAGKVAFDVATAATLTVNPWTKHKAFCFWSLLAATATFATAPLAVGEARAALANVSQRMAGQLPPGVIA
jgi:hypothetical protein